MTNIAPPPATGRFRRRILVVSIGVLLVIGAAWGMLGRHPAPSEPASAPIPATPPPPQAAAEASSPPPSQAPSEPSAQAAAPTAEAPTTAPAPSPAAAPAAPEPPPLTAVQVAERPVHEVPPDARPPKPDSVALDLSRPPPGAAGRHPSEGSTASAPKQFAGAARVTGATSLMVGAVPVQLFGVKPPLAGDRCEQGGVPTSCVELAKKRLLERLNASDQVNCRTPNPQPGMVVAFAICLDPHGIDLGSYLLNEGLALADTGQSYDYVGAEGVAKTLKHGLWKFR